MYSKHGTVGTNQTRRTFLRTAAVGAVGGISSVTGCIGQATDSGEAITFGAILPTSVEGAIGKIGQHHSAAVQQAVADINDAGGVSGREIALDVRDSKATAETALEEYQSLVEADALGFVGGVLSSVSIEIAGNVADDQIMQVSPASTSPSLSEMGKAGDLKYFGRTVPNDVLQSFVMAKILNEDQYIDADTAAILYIDDAFGKGLAEKIESAFDGELVTSQPFDPSADDHQETIRAAVADNPDGIAVVGVPGSTESVLQQRLEVENDAEWVLSAGLIPADPPSFYNGLYSGSLASAQATGAAKLDQKLSQFDQLAPFTRYAYDAMFLQALALERADEVSSEGIASNLQTVSAGRGHTVTVGEFDRAKKLLSNGREVNYMGASGRVDLLPALEPLAPYLVQYVEDGSVDNVELLKTSYFREVMEG